MQTQAPKWLELPCVVAFHGGHTALLVTEEFDGIYAGVVCDSPIRVATFAESELHAATPILLNGEPYPADKLAQRWLYRQGLSNYLGVSGAARKLLEDVIPAANTLRGKKMSIEQAILTLAAALTEVAAAVRGGEAAETTAAPAAAPAAGAEPPKRGRGRPPTAATPVGSAAPAPPPPMPGAAAHTQQAQGLFTSPPAAQPPLQPPQIQTAAPSSLPASYTEVQQALLQLDATKGREVVVAILSRYGVKALPELLPEQYGNMLNEVRATLSGAANPLAAQQTAGGMFG